MTLPEREPVVLDGEYRLLWIGTAVTLIAAIVALVVVIFAKKRQVNVDQLGSVSDHWIAEHHVDSP